MTNINCTIKQLSKEFSELHNISLSYNPSLRQRSITTNDAIEYAFGTSQYKCSKVEVVENLNIKNNVSHTPSAYYKKESNIPIESYKHIFYLLNTTHNSILNSYPILKHKQLFNLSYTEDDIVNMCNMEEYIFIAVDGSKISCYGKLKGTTVTHNCLFVYDIIHGNVLYMSELCEDSDMFQNNCKNLSDKNHETLKFSEYLENNYKHLHNKYPNKKIVFVLDRAYHSNKIVTLLKKYNFDYIMRIKNNSKLIDNNDSQNYNRVVSHIHTSESEFIHNKMKYTYEYTDPINLLTSIPINIANNKTIHFIYSLRWNIELYFKRIKNNTNIDFVNTNIFSQVEKLKYISASIEILTKIIISMYYIHTKFKCKSLMPNEITYYKINFSKVMRNVYSQVLNKLLNNKLTSNDIHIIFSNSIEIKKYDKNRKFNRVSINSVCKWYPKGYSNKAQYKKLVIAKVTNNYNNLNKNDISKLSRITIISVTKIKKIT